MWTISWCRPLIRRADPGRIPPIRQNSDAIPRPLLFLRMIFYSRSSPASGLLFLLSSLCLCFLPRSFSFLFPLFNPRTFTTLSLSSTSPRRRLSPLAALLRLCGLVVRPLLSLFGCWLEPCALRPGCLLRFPSIFFFSFYFYFCL
jgi:hypothetical protein